MKRLFAGIPEYLHNNFLFYYLDIGVWGLYTGSTIVFLSVYATREGATSQQIGWMSAGPAIISLLLSIPAGLFARSFSPKRSVVWSAFMARLLLLVYVFIPTFVSESQRIPALLLVTFLIAIPNTLLMIAFGPMMITALPAEWRGVAVSMRNAIMSVISFVVTLACGQILVRLPYPTGYQVVFFIGFVGAFATTYMLHRVQVLEPDEESLPPAPGLARRFLPRVDQSGRHYLMVMALLFSMSMAGFMVAPLLPQLYVHQLKLNDDVISIGTAISSMLVFLVSLAMPRFIRRISNRNGTAIGMAILFVQTLLLAAAGSPAAFLVASVVGGLAAGVLGVSQYNYHLDNIPRLDRTVWVSWNSVLGNLAALMGAVAGPALAGVIGIPWTLAILAVLRLVIGAAVWWFG